MPRLAEIEVSADELAAARAGEVAARRVLFDRVAPGALAIIRRLVRHKAQAEDLLQDTLIAMFEHLAEFRGEAPFGAWVRRIAVSRCLMSFRSPWHRARVTLDTWMESGDASSFVMSAIESGPPASDLIDVDRALARLSPVTRTVVWLYDVEGWTHEEIAHAFERTVSFSKSQLARGHARLRDELMAPVDVPCATLGSELDGH
jgi:RNA polymerase sigma factor (sigma-70 family)